MSRSTRRVLSNAQLPPAERFWSELHHAPTRRRDPRVHANVPVCVSVDKGAQVETRSNDLSYHGMQLRCDRKTAATLRPQAHGKGAHSVYPVTLQLGIDGVSFSVSTHARVAHVSLVNEASPDTEVAIGMTFVRFEKGAQAALHRFIDQHLLPAGWP